MRCQLKEEAFLGTACTARWENGGNPVKISPSTDLAPGQPVTEMSFPTRMIELWRPHRTKHMFIREVAEKHVVSCYLRELNKVTLSHLVTCPFSSSHVKNT